MNNDKNIIDIYAAELSSSEKEHLLMAYYDYVALVCYLEEVFKFQGVNRLAYEEATKNKVTHIWPWNISAMSDKEKQIYANFVAGQPQNDDEKYCFVSINHTSQRYKDEGAGIIFTPDHFEVVREGNPLPHRVERYVAAYPQEATLATSEFLTDGRFCLCYVGDDAENKSVSEAFNDETFKRTFLNTLDMLSQYPDDVFITKDFLQSQVFLEKFMYPEALGNNGLERESLSHIINLLGNDFDNQIYVDDSLQYRVLNETLASATLAPFENMILDALSILAEESHEVIKKTIGHRAGRNYLAQAEKEKLLASSVNLQDYLNIRHLIRHQWDTLDNVGKVGEHQIIKNASVRQRFLDSYAKLCDKPLNERIKSYFAVRDDFIPLVVRLNPFVFVREKGESNNHLFARIKEYRRRHPDQKIFIETGLHQDKEKRNNFIKNLEKHIGHVEIMDNSTEQLANLGERLNGFQARRRFVEAYSDLEYMVCQYALFSGQSLTPPNAWNWLKKTKFLTPQDFDMWSKYRKIRNTLSHKYTDNELNQKVRATLPDFVRKASVFEDKLFDVMPQVHRIEGSHYRAFHQNGKVVDFDLERRKILGVSQGKNIKQKKYSDGASPMKNEADAGQRRKSRTYTEEYPNGTSITLSGTEIQSFRLNNGITLDVNKNYLYYADGVKFYFENPKRLYMIFGKADKAILDSDLELIKYIKNGKIVFFGANDCIRVGNNRAFLIGKRENLVEEAWLAPNGQKMYHKYAKKNNEIFIHYSDGTTILIKPSGSRIWHNGEELTYTNRKKFVESYNQESGAKPSSTVAFLLNPGYRK